MLLIALTKQTSGTDVKIAGFIDCHKRTILIEFIKNYNYILYL